MMFKSDIFGHGLVVCFVLLTTLGTYAQPSWVTPYPQLLSGATSVDIKVQTDSSGTIYYAIYKTAQNGITSAQLKNDALVGGNLNLVKRGSVAIASNVLQTIKQTALTQNTTYYAYIVAESTAGLMADNKISYTSRFFPKRQQEFYNYSNAVQSTYLMYFPEDYYKSSTTYPLLVFLGGSGEMSRGGVPNPDKLLATGLPQVINLGKDVPMIVASPQGIWSWNGTQVYIDAYIEFLKATYRVDASQIFLTGLSDGGEGVFAYGNAYPSKVKAIVPVSTWPIGADIHNFLNVPVWGFMGSSDTNGQIHQWINALKAIGGNATYTEYPGGHSSSVWNPVYDGSKGDDIYQWMLNVVVLPPANLLPMVNAGADQSLSLPLPQLQLTGTASDADGTITSYAWTKISGPAVTLTNPETSILTLTSITSGTYVFQLGVIDNAGASVADQVTIFVNAGGTISREFDVNITGEWNKQGGTWNDLVTTGGGIVGNSVVLFDNHNIASSVSLSIIAPFQELVNHGVILGIYPANVMRCYVSSTTTRSGTLKLSGLNVNNVYDLSILSSDMDLWYPSDTRLTVNGEVAIINARGNANQLANFLSVAPNPNGEITITVAPATTTSTNIGVINALVIKERLPNVAPVVDAGPNQQFTLPLNQLQLTGTATDTDGAVASLQWSAVSGPAVTMTNTTTSTLTLTNLLSGKYVFQLSAQDDGGAITNDQDTVTVSPPTSNIAPVVNAGADQLVTLPLSQLQFTGTATDSDGTVDSLRWTEISGPAVTLANATTSTLEVSNILAGTYIFQLSAKDNTGATTTDQVTVIVSPAPIASREFDINVTWAWNKGGPPWNDLISTNGGIAGNSVILFDKSGVASTITLSITAPFVDGVNNHGVWPGLYPNNVMMYYLRSTTTQVGSLKLAGLNTAKQYDLSILSSNVDVWYSSDTRLTVQGQSATVNAKGNTGQLVNFMNISPTAMGEIPIIVAPANTNSTSCGVINAIILTEHDGSNPAGRTTTQNTAMADPTPAGDFVNVFPNPVEDQLNVDITSSLPTPETFSIEFTDIRGAQVYTRQVASQVGTSPVSERIPADFMQSGLLYIMAVRSQQGGVQYFKILKK